MNEKQDGDNHKDCRRHNTIHNSAKKTLFADIETTGINILSLSFVIVDDDSRETIVKFQQVIKPVDFEIPEDERLLRLNITKQRANFDGMLIEEALIYLNDAVERCSRIVSCSVCADLFALTFQFTRFKYGINRLLSTEKFDVINFGSMFFNVNAPEKVTLEQMHKFVHGYSMRQPSSQLERLKSIQSIYFEMKDLRMFK